MCQIYNIYKYIYYLLIKTINPDATDIIERRNQIDYAQNNGQSNAATEKSSILPLY